MSFLHKSSLGKTIAIASLVFALFASVSATPASAEHGYGGGGGGGGDPECFRPWRPDADSIKVKIEGGDPIVRTRNVKLTLKAPTAKKMAISNSAAFTGASIQDFDNKLDWTLTAGEGVKTVYVRFYNKCGSSSPVVTDSIEYRLPSPPPGGGGVLGEEITLVDKLIAKLNLGDSNNDVKKLQTEFVRLGYLPASWRVNSNYNATVFAAAERWADAHPSHDLDGMMSRLRFGQYHPDVRRLQAELKRRGFMPRNWSVTSFYGLVTRLGIAAYRRG